MFLLSGDATDLVVLQHLCLWGCLILQHSEWAGLHFMGGETEAQQTGVSCPSPPRLVFVRSLSRVRITDVLCASADCASGFPPPLWKSDFKSCALIEFFGLIYPRGRSSAATFVTAREVLAAPGLQWMPAGEALRSPTRLQRGDADGAGRGSGKQLLSVCCGSGAACWARLRNL